MPGAKIRREITVGNKTCLLSFAGRDSVDSAVFDSSTLQPGGIDEVQTLSITGAPTGGTFTLSFNGQTTAAIAYNATAAQVQTALRALSRLGAGIVVGGGPLPGTAVTITFTGAKLGKKDQPLITVASNALTGGTAPAPTVVETTKGDSKFANLYVLLSGLPLMRNGAGDKVVEWDGASAATLVGIFDGQRRAARSGGLSGHPGLQPRVRVRQGREGQELRRVHGQLQHLGCGARVPVQVQGT
jgi:hypothetical protein